MQTPEPLPEGTLLHERYWLSGVLGAGGFGITYRATDRERGDSCVVKELAPSGASRCADQRIEMAGLGSAQAQRLRHQFLAEAKLLRGLQIPGILSVRDLFQENATSYYVTQYVEGSVTLQRWFQQDGRLDVAELRPLLLSLLGTLARLHDRGLLHRDIKPSNILRGPDHSVYLIDFGSAREWVADATVHHTVLFTPHFAPIEQMSVGARRGPGTDLYGLCATAYWLLTGELPTPATDRAAGVALVPLRDLRPDIEPEFAEIIESGLSLRLTDRPASADELIRRLEAEHHAPDDYSRLELLDRKTALMRALKPGKRECPACSGVLTEVKPLAPNLCPVCREGRLKPRGTELNLCPVCHVGRLQPHDYSNKPGYCPVCRTGHLRPEGVPVPWKARVYRCEECDETFEVKGDTMRRPAVDISATITQWREASGRAAIVQVCDGCDAEFDELTDGRRKLVKPVKGVAGYDLLYPEEWALIAKGFDPGSGNLYCGSCDADYFVDAESLTLLHHVHDPYRFAARFEGRILPLSAIPWAGAGKASGLPGLTCHQCATEFDYEGDELALAFSEHPVLARHENEVHSIPDWHRIAHELPLVGQEDELTQQMADAIESEFRAGNLPFDARKPDLFWQGTLLIDGAPTPLTIHADEIVLGGMLRKKRLALVDVEGIQTDGDMIELTMADGAVLEGEVEPIDFTVELPSNRVTIELDAGALGAMLERRIRLVSTGR